MIFLESIGSRASLSARGVNRMISPLFFVSNTINTKRKEPHHADAAPFRYTTKKNLFDSCPVKCCANTKDCATQFQLIGIYKLSGYIHANTFRWVINLGSTPHLFFCIVLPAYYYHHLINIHIAQRLVWVLHVFTLITLCIMRFSTQNT